MNHDLVHLPVLGALPLIRQQTYEVGLPARSFTGTYLGLVEGPLFFRTPHGSFCVPPAQIVGLCPREQAAFVRTLFPAEPDAAWRQPRTYPLPTRPLL